jgi:hypothetical protein
MKTVPGLDPLRRFFETPPIPLIDRGAAVAGGERGGRRGFGGSKRDCLPPDQSGIRR